MILEPILHSVQLWEHECSKEMREERLSIRYNDKKNFEVFKKFIYFMNMRYGIVFHELTENNVADIHNHRGKMRVQLHIWQPWFCYLILNWFTLLERRLCSGIENNNTARHKAKITFDWLDNKEGEREYFILIGSSATPRSILF